MSRTRLTIRLVLVLLALAGTASPSAAQRPTRVAAASDLKFALEEVVARFNAQSGAHVEVVFGASGLLTRQLIDGAPFELFLSADEALVDQLVEAGVARDRGVLYAIGRLVIFAPHGSPLAVDPRLEGLRTYLKQGGKGRFAIANPQTAPYGRAAEAALRTLRLWEPLQPGLVLGENIAQTATFATTGNAVGGILAHSLVLAPPLRDRGTYALLPESLHPPLRQRMALIKGAGPTAQRFYQYIQDPPAREILGRYGFSVPK